MIPATVPCYARFKVPSPIEGEPPNFEFRRVMAWDDDGTALIAPDKGSAVLLPVDKYRNFVGLSEQSTSSQHLALIPAGGWRVEYTEDDGNAWSEPLVGWALREDGSVEPLVTDSQGLVDDTSGLGDTCRIYHDEQRDASAPLWSPAEQHDAETPGAHPRQ